MKKLFSILTLILLVVLMLTSCDIFVADTPGVIYEISSDSPYTYAVVVDYEGDDTEVKIAKEYNGVPVKVIYDGAFKGNSDITSINIPDSVTSIGNEAFVGCTSLSSVKITKSITSIGHSAFAGCTSLTSAKIPDVVKSIGNYAFAGCTGLTSVVIGDSVTSIGEGAFYGCTGLTSVVIPDSVTSIDGWAFYGCTGLTDVYYAGSEEDWVRINYDIYIYELFDIEIHCNYAP